MSGRPEREPPQIPAWLLVVAWGCLLGCALIVGDPLGIVHE